MRVIIPGFIAVGLALSVASPIHAQITCDDLVFDEEATTNYPEVSEACLEVVVQDGVNYARFHARVVQPGSRSLVIQYEHRDGTWGEPKTVTPPEDFRFIIDGDPTPADELGRWQELNIYLPEGRWRMAITDLAPIEKLEVYPEPVPQIASPEIVVPDPPPPEVAAADPEPEAAADPEPEAAADPEPDPVPAEQPFEAEQPEEGGPSMMFLLFGVVAVILVAVFLMKRRKA